MLIDADAYTIVYMEVLVLCIAYSLIFLRRTNTELGSNLEIIIFRWFLRTFIVMLIVDGYTQLQYNDIIHPPLITVAFGYSVYQFMLCALSVMWFFFAELQIAGALPHKKVILYGAVLPLFVMGILAFGTIKTGWLFTFDGQEHFVRGPYFIILMLFAYVFFMVTTVHAFVRYSRETSRYKKRRLLLVASFIIAPTIGAALQIVIGGAPFVSPSICIAFIYIFVNIQSDLVNGDALTGLNNRRSMEKYLEDLRGTVSYKHPYYFFIADADEFKKINDSYGHAEGDNALRLIADALKATGDEYRGFIARYGGDEFVVILDAEFNKDPEDFMDDVRKNLAILRDEKGTPYELTLSIGYSMFDHEDLTTPELIARADRMMFASKKSL